MVLIARATGNYLSSDAARVKVKDKISCNSND